MTPRRYRSASCLLVPLYTVLTFPLGALDTLLLPLDFNIKWPRHLLPVLCDKEPLISTSSEELIFSARYMPLGHIEANHTFVWLRNVNVRIYCLDVYTDGHREESVGPTYMNSDEAHSLQACQCFSAVGGDRGDIA